MALYSVLRSVSFKLLGVLLSVLVLLQFLFLSAVCSGSSTAGGACIGVESFWLCGSCILLVLLGSCLPVYPFVVVSSGLLSVLLVVFVLF